MTEKIWKTSILKIVIFKFYKNTYKILTLKVRNNKGIKTTLFCNKGTKLKHKHTGNITSYSWEKDDCLQDLQNRQDSEKLNFTELAKKYSLWDQSGINILSMRSRTNWYHIERKTCYIPKVKGYHVNRLESVILAM